MFHNKIYKQKNKEDNLIAIAKNFISYCKLSINLFSVKKKLEAHPDYPTLGALADTFLYWNIKTLSLKLSPDQLNSIPLPAVVHFHGDNGGFMLLTKISHEFVFYIDPVQGKRIKESISEFNKKWSGYTLLTETNKYSGEENFEQKKREAIKKKVFKIFFTIIFIFLLLKLLTQVKFLELNLLLILKLIGFIVSFFLIKKEVGGTGFFLDKICNWNEKTNCEKVLNSSASKIFGWRFSEIGLLYFSGGFLALLFTSFNLSTNFNGIYLILMALNVISLPYTIFSIFYQWRIINQWCPLCLLIQLILWIEYFIFMSFMSWEIPSWNTFVLIGLWSFLLPVFIWSLIRSNIFKINEYKEFSYQVQKFKRNSSVFKVIMDNEINFNGCDIPHELIFGNKDADHVLTILLSFRCPACKDLYLKLNSIEYLFENIKIKIRFANEKNKDIMDHLLSLLIVEDEDIVKEAIKAKYMTKNVLVWKKQFPIKIKPDDAEISALRNAYKKWLVATRVNYSPALFLNEARLPHFYSIDDLKIHLMKL